ncbi:MAG: hypothetical protein GX488_02375, partial [Clostridiales bacterium]|nr:hypothetical protein [Clostridiales bacterium]
NSLTVQKSGEASPLTLTAAVFNANNEITNNGAANIVVGNDCVTLKLPSKGTWTITSGTSAFDISCYYASPYASLDGMNLTGMTLTGSVKDMNSKTNYILRTYFGTERGGTDYILSQSGVPAGGTIGETLSLSGSMAPTGSYYVTTVLQEEITGDFNGDGINESAYVTTDTFVFDTMVNYVNSEQPDAPSNVTIESIGSELMRVRWKPASGGNSADGYYIRLYRQGNSGWVDTGAGYLLKASDLTKDAEGYYTYDMAVTAGDASLHLEAGNTYKAGIAAFCYLTDKDGDGKNDSFPVESAETYSTGQYLPKATYPVLTYLPSLSPDGSSMKLLFVKGATQVTITSDVAANIVVTRMDTDTVVTQTPSSSTTLVFDTPADFTGALNLRITATDADGDITVDYIGLRMDETAPLITLDSASFMADRGTGEFSVTGVTESGGTVSVTGVITDSGTSGTVLDAEKVTADENGIFTITGKLNPVDTAKGLSAADSAILLLCASDLANNVSEGTFAQVVRATEASYTEGGSTGSSNSITADSTGSISSGLLKTAVQAAGKGGTVTVETSGSSVSVTGEGLQYLINNECALRLSTSRGTMLIPSKVLAGLKITAESRIEFVLSRPESFNDPKLKVLAAAGYPIYKISILIDGKAIHKLSGEISVMLKGTTFAALDSLSVIHALDNGVYRAIEHTLANGELSFTLDSLSHICVLDGKMAADLLKNPFSDVEKSNWFYNNVLYVYQAGLMLGADSNAFCPYAGATRAMLVTILQRLNCDAESYKSIFSDVPSGAWYESAVGWAAANGIANGVGNGLFAPDNRITREQLAVMLCNYAKFKGYDVSVGDDTNILSFNDALSISNYAYPAMQWACGNGIINGDTAGNLNPGGYATRAEVAAMLERFIQNTIE